VPGEVGFFDERIGPEPLHQVVLLHHLSVVFDQSQQSFQVFDREGNDFPVPHQQHLCGIEPVGTELVEHPGWRRFCHGGKSFMFLSGFVQDAGSPSRLE
jgi:hypothetical protein